MIFQYLIRVSTKFYTAWMRQKWSSTVSINWQTKQMDMWLLWWWSGIWKLLFRQIMSVKTQKRRICQSVRLLSDIWLSHKEAHKHPPIQVLIKESENNRMLLTEDVQCFKRQWLRRQGQAGTKKSPWTFLIRPAHPNQPADTLPSPLHCHTNTQDLYTTTYKHNWRMLQATLSSQIQ